MDYVLPLKATDTTGVTELAEYLRGLAAVVDVTVVDGSAPDIFVHNHRVLGKHVLHVPVSPEQRCTNGKVAGVRTGFRLCRSQAVVVADDDVRYEPWQLRRLAAELDGADVLRPQNYFAPLPWHARWDTGRSLLNRAFGGDYPGTLALRLTPALCEFGYDGDVLFENLELIRTVRAAGGRERVLADLFVRRRPPSASHFWSQRTRQAYDSLAQPPRLLAELCILPVTAALLHHARRDWRPAAACAVAVVGSAEVGRRKAAGARWYPATAALWALPWLLERGCCVWAALALRLSGRGVRYGGASILRAANPLRELRKQRAGCAAG